MDTNYSEHMGNHLQLRYEGLTKREYFAAMAMQGMLSSPNGGVGSTGSKYFSPNEISRLSIIHADELLKQLDEIK